MRLPFFEKALELQARYARLANPRHPPPMHNTIPTNGTIVDDDGVNFIVRSKFLVGVSLDGPPAWHVRPGHERYRLPAPPRRGVRHIDGGQPNERATAVRTVPLAGGPGLRRPPVNPLNGGAAELPQCRQRPCRRGGRHAGGPVRTLPG